MKDDSKRLIAFSYLRSRVMARLEEGDVEQLLVELRRPLDSLRCDSITAKFVGHLAEHAFKRTGRPDVNGLMWDAYFKAASLDELFAQELQEALEKQLASPQKAHVHYRLGLLHQNHHRFLEAEQHYKAAAEDNAAYRHPYHFLALREVRSFDPAVRIPQDVRQIPLIQEGVSLLKAVDPGRKGNPSIKPREFVTHRQLFNAIEDPSLRLWYHHVSFLIFFARYYSAESLGTNEGSSRERELVLFDDAGIPYRRKVISALIRERLDSALSLLSCLSRQGVKLSPARCCAISKLFTNALLFLSHQDDGRCLADVRRREELFVLDQL